MRETDRWYLVLLLREGTGAVRHDLGTRADSNIRCRKVVAHGNTTDREVRADVSIWSVDIRGFMVHITANIFRARNCQGSHHIDESDPVYFLDE